MTERLPQENTTNSKQIVNLNYLDREAQLYKDSKTVLENTAKVLSLVVKTNAK